MSNSEQRRLDHQEVCEFATWRPDREICPRWAALCQLYRTMLNARRQPGVRFVCSVPAELAEELARVARAERCEAKVSPNCIDHQVAAVSVTWAAKEISGQLSVVSAEN